MSRRSPSPLLHSARLGAIVLSLAVAACGGATTPADPAGSDGRLDVYTVNYPLLYFAERIGGDRVRVSLPAPADADPALWSPSPELIGRYQQADLILLHGAGYAGWVARAALPRSRTVDTGAALAGRWIPLKDVVTHSHGAEGEHSHAGSAVETWLDPTLAIEHAKAIAAAFSSARPEHEAEFAAGLAALVSDLEGLDESLREATAGLEDQLLVFSHPMFEYLIDRYQLLAESVHWEAATVPGHFRLVELDEKLAGRPAAWMIWHAEPSAEAVGLLEERGMGSVVVSPCANRPGDGDFLSVMRANAAALATIG